MGYYPCFCKIKIKYWETKINNVCISFSHMKVSRSGVKVGLRLLRWWGIQVN